MMATKSGSYIELQQRRYSDKKKTLDFDVVSTATKARLGEIRWYAPWRRYVFVPFWNTLFDAACLHDITGALTRLMTEHHDK